jgi:glycosyltransferase involved in cell wall biosynthesis
MIHFFNIKLSQARALIRKLWGYPFIRNVYGVDCGEGRPRCLLVYLSVPFTRSSNHPSFLTHQNLSRAKMMASVLNTSGYVVDVADVRSAHLPRSCGVYDLIVTHQSSLEFLEGHFDDHSVVVYLATGLPHAEQNRRVKDRLAALEKRRHCLLPMVAVADEVMSVLARADAITGTGSFAGKTAWESVFSGPVHLFNNHGFGWIRPAEVMDDDSGRHFLFLGSVNQVLKGLDQLLDTFSQLPDFHLHIAGYYEKEYDFCACYKQELYQTPNIHGHGYIVIGSPQWDALVRRCAFVILPSCSEGQAGAVVQAMHAGLIPVVTPGVGIDAGAFGVMLPEDPFPVLGETVVRLGLMPPEALQKLRKATLTAAHEQYSEASFSKRWREIVDLVKDRGRVGMCDRSGSRTGARGSC